MDEANWDDYIQHMRRYLDSGQIEKEELGPKRATEREVQVMRDAVLAGNPDWPALWKKAKLEPRLCDWRSRSALQNWFRNDPQGSRDALRRLWALGDRPRGQMREHTGNTGWTVSAEEAGARIRAFVPRWPTAFKGAGTRMRPISVLLMALGAECCPPFKTTEFKETYARLGYRRPDPDSDEAGLYEHALRFLDRLIDEAQARGFDRPGDRLEAQSVVWALQNQFAGR